MAAIFRPTISSTIDLFVVQDSEMRCCQSGWALRMFSKSTLPIAPSSYEATSGQSKRVQRDATKSTKLACISFALSYTQRADPQQSPASLSVVAHRCAFRRAIRWRDIPRNGLTDRYIDRRRTEMLFHGGPSATSLTGAWSPHVHHRLGPDQG